MITSSSSHTFSLFWVKKWIPPSRSKTTEIGQKNIRNFRGSSGGSETGNIYETPFRSLANLRASTLSPRKSY
jgi:hypothetical protein